MAQEKSFLISKFIDWANENDRDIRVTALTGCAALLLGKTAKTLHSFGGFKANVGKIPNEDILKDIQKNVKNANGQENYEYLNPWQKREKSAANSLYFNYMTDILVVDEVSMVDTVMLDLLDKSCRMVRKTPNEAFGGIQVVFVGDMFQLPPVNKEGKFVECFKHPLWKTFFPPENCIQLTKVFRQDNHIYVNMLNRVRKGALLARDKKLLKSRLIENLDMEKEPYGKFKRTKLYPKNEMVDSENLQQFNELRGDIETFEL